MRTDKIKNNSKNKWEITGWSVTFFLEGGGKSLVQAGNLLPNRPFNFGNRTS